MGSVRTLFETTETQFGTAHVGKDIFETTFAGINSVDPCYREISDFVDEHNLEAEFYNRFNYKDAPFAPPSSNLQKKAQSRRNGLNKEKRENYTTRFDDGETLDYACVMVEIGQFLYIGVGNHRGYGKRECENNYFGKALIIRQGNTSEDIQQNILLKIASMGNTETKQDKDTDSMEDLAKQVHDAWEEITNVDLKGTSSVTKYEREIRSAYIKREEDDKEGFRRTWFDKWMLSNKPLSFRDASKQTLIYNSAFSQEHGQPIKEYSDADLKKCFKKHFIQYDWDPEVWSMRDPNNKKIHQLQTRWKTFERNIFRELAEPFHTGASKVDNVKVHLIVEGSSSLRKIESRNEEIKTMLQKFTKWNLNEKTIDWDLPIIDKVVLPMALRDCGDSDHAYSWNDQKNKFFKQSKQLKEE